LGHLYEIDRAWLRTDCRTALGNEFDKVSHSY
jgi:hypothetical protein